MATAVSGVKDESQATGDGRGDMTADLNEKDAVL